MITSLLALLVVFCLALAGSHYRTRRRLRWLEHSMLIDPGTLLGTPFALEREFEHMCNAGQPASYADLRVLDPSRAREAISLLRSICAHGVDLIFCTDLSRGCFSLLTTGNLEPSLVATFFHEEFRSRRIEASIGWAYTCSPDPKVRARLREAAHKALAIAMAARVGFEVILVDPEGWPAEDPNQVLIDNLRFRREALCLLRKELAPVLGIGELDLRDLEVGRAASASRAKHIQAVLETIEQSVLRVQKLEETMRLSSPPQGSPLPQAEEARLDPIIALQASLRERPRQDASVPTAESQGTSAQKDRDVSPRGEADNVPEQ